MNKWLATLHNYWSSLRKAATTRIIALSTLNDGNQEIITALEYLPGIKSFQKISPLDSVLESKDHLILVSLEPSKLFYGKIEGLPSSFATELFRKKDKIEAQIAQKILWDLAPYAYQYEFENVDGKKKDLHFMLASKEALQIDLSKWENRGICPAAVLPASSAIKEYLSSEKISFPCLVLIKQGLLIDLYEFRSFSDFTYSTVKEGNLSSLKKDHKPIIANFYSSSITFDFVDSELLLKGLCLSSLRPLRKWSTTSWIKELKKILPLSIPKGKNFQRVVYSFLALGICFSLFRFFSLQNELNNLGVDIPFGQMSAEKELFEHDLFKISLINKEHETLKKILHEESLETLSSLSNHLYPLSIEIDKNGVQVVFAPIDEEFDELQKEHIVKKIEDLHGNVVLQDQKSLIVKIPTR